MTKEEDYFRLLLSQPIWDEYSTVADWLIPKERHEEKERILRTLRLHADWIEPIMQVDVCSDKSDNRFLECAVEGKADYLVTKNIRHFPSKEYQSVKIVRVRTFLEVLEKIERSQRSQIA